MNTCEETVNKEPFICSSDAGTNDDICLDESCSVNEGTEGNSLSEPCQT